jgi:hypothetical protein
LSDPEVRCAVDLCSVLGLVVSREKERKRERERERERCEDVKVKVPNLALA